MRGYAPKLQWDGIRALAGYTSFLPPYMIYVT